MNKVFDYGFTGSFFTNDVKAVSDIERSKMHEICRSINNYMKEQNYGCIYSIFKQKRY